MGNISLIAKVSGGKVSYAYDSLNQLIREDNEFLGKTICYTYDLGGNMTGDETTEEAIKAVQDEINSITTQRFKTHAAYKSVPVMSA